MKDITKIKKDLQDCNFDESYINQFKNKTLASFTTPIILTAFLGELTSLGIFFHNQDNYSAGFRNMEIFYLGFIPLYSFMTLYYYHKEKKYKNFLKTLSKTAEYQRRILSGEINPEEIQAEQGLDKLVDKL